MLRNTYENEILEKALDKFVNVTGLKIKIIDKKAKTLNRRIDAVINIEGQNCIVEVKTNINNAMMAMMIAVKENVTKKLILVTRYVNQNMAEELKRYNIQFIDVAGNTYINLPPIYINITGKRNPYIHAQKENKRAFQQTGLKVIFALFNNPDLINTTYRNIAEEVKVALGTVNWTMRDLKQDMFVIDKGHLGKVLNNKKELLDKWIIYYPEKLRTKLVLGKFKTKNPDWWKEINIQDYDAQWGGEVAAHLMTKYLIPQDIKIYINEHRMIDFIIDNNLIQDPNGNIELLKRFWKKENNTIKEIVPALLVYADLINTGDPRNIEAANMIYNDEIIRYI